MSRSCRYLPDESCVVEIENLTPLLFRATTFERQVAELISEWVPLNVVLIICKIVQVDLSQALGQLTQILNFFLQNAF